MTMWIAILRFIAPRRLQSPELSEIQENTHSKHIKITAFRSHLNLMKFILTPIKKQVI